MRRPLVFVIALIFATAAPASPVLAAPAGSPTPSAATLLVTRLDAIETKAHAVDMAATSSDWAAARRIVERIAKDAAAVRADAGKRLKTQAYAQSLDASVKWLSSAVERKSAAEVKRSIASLKSTVRELRERAHTT